MRVVVVTGGSSGIGLAAATALARNGDEVVLLGSHPGRLAKAVEQVTDAAGGVAPASFRADFAHLDEVRAVGDKLVAAYPRIDVLVNNAGGLAPYPGAATADGYDRTMQVNHLAGFLLANLLRPNLAGGRLITTASLAEVWGWLDPERPAPPGGRYRSRWLAYGASKQANILFTVEAARRWAPEVTPTCFFPGLVRSRFVRRSPLFALGSLIPVLVASPKRGADTLVWLADPATRARPGAYYFLRREFAATPRATNPDRARLLWEASAAAVLRLG
ncbi:SDR family NAD(P)-dependent oxidoreductase [Virgisporangium aurantiacum]|uniref:Short-chain dehydrogenase n=1 Tax=Virgisporangium aurantiacum TaxID=175570 RepID=A0A8J3ZI32_9ACTN|nr:SDR family NAD(P)-dependent oxidoreductase [Virgisporangium aurantiacum]GIJ64517.1 short-chain dehydrogenase [Virgisporangium aurantiacum]